jgi:EmrB/QacA subfamily drug resistance transporter
LGADNAKLQWISGGYLLALSAAMLPVGMLGDRIGHKRLLVGGMGLFGASSLVGVWVDSPGAVIAVRVALGLGAATILPLSMAILPRVFAHEELGRAIGTWTAAAALGLPIGPVVGGWLLNHFWWGSIFLFNVPVVAVAMVASLVLLPSDSTRSTADATRAAPFDGLGTVLSALGITSVVYGTIRVPNDGWGSPFVLATLLAGVALLAAFVLRQRRFSHPLVNLGLFSDPRFRWGSVLAVFVNFAAVGILFVVPQYLGGVLGQDAFGTGLRVLPLIGGLMVAAALAETLVPRLGARAVIPTGFVLLAVGALIGANTDSGNGYGFAVGWLALTGFGFGLAVVPATSLVLSSLPKDSAGSGTSLLETLQQVGGVLGVAALGSLLSYGFLDRLSVTGIPAPAADAARGSVTAADAVAGQLHNPDLLASAHNAFIHGMSLVLAVCGVISLLAAALAARFLPGRSREAAAPEAVTEAPERGESLV